MASTSPYTYALPSLVYPTDSPRPPASRAQLNFDDLGLGPIISALDFNGQHYGFIAALLAELTTDERTIGYRQAILQDFLRNTALAEHISTLLKHIRALNEPKPFRQLADTTPLLQVAARVAELDHYVTCVEGLYTALTNAEYACESDGLQLLQAAIHTLRSEQDYVHLTAELPALRARLEEVGSVTLGINLDAQLRPESATVVSLNPGRFVGRSTLLERLFGPSSASEATRGITALYKAESNTGQTSEHELFRDINRLLERVVRPIATVIDQYKRVHVGALATLEPELAFYIGAAQLTNTIRSLQLPLCHATFVPAQQRTCVVKEMYNLGLVLRLRNTQNAHVKQIIVTNDIALTQQATVALLTGPNSGGKTTFVRAIGQAQVLFQAGLLVPGSAAQISPVDAILTHFAVPERLDLAGGRLAEELGRLATIFQTASPQSLVLLNEPLTSTDHISARTIGRSLLKGLLQLGARALFVTHLYELVDEAASQEDTRSRIVSLVARAVVDPKGSTNVTPSYRIELGAPQIMQYASEIAQQYGLSADQISATLQQRGINTMHLDAENNVSK